MTYKLNPFLEKIIAPVILIISDGEKQYFQNGRELTQQMFDRFYLVDAVSAEAGNVIIRLKEQKNMGETEDREDISLF